MNQQPKVGAIIRSSSLLFQAELKITTALDTYSKNAKRLRLVTAGGSEE